MGKAQWIALAVALFIVGLLYVGFDTKPREFAKIEQSRSLQIRSTGIESLLIEARSQVHGPDANRIMGLEKQLNPEDPDPEVLKALSSAWYAQGFPAIAGHYAFEVAQVERTAEAWSIAGTTFSLALQKSSEEKLRRFCLENGVESFENAISLEPHVVQHRLNLALLYTEEAPADNPMQGILMLVDLSKKHPEEGAVFFHLGRLALQTGQTDKALERLTRAIELRPDHRDSWCLLAEAKQLAGDSHGAEEARVQCDHNF
jgi:predicted Zn-dependent protease